MKLNRRLKRVCFLALYALFLLLLAELGARAFWKARGVPFFTAHRNIHQSFYPSISRLEREPLRKECFDVLLLGASVLHTDFGNIEHVLRERLSRAKRSCVRIHNLSALAHTSLDSYYKYRHVTNKKFDLVVVYHGINEVRANNCPSAVFRSDYAHFSWYRLINDFERQADSRWLILPYTVEFAALKIVDRLGWSGFLPTHKPGPESLDYGCDVKTVGSFRNNLAGIIGIAARKKEPVLLMSFSYYIPEGYSEERFWERSLDFTAHTFPVELWGKPECVAAAIVAQNAIVEELAGEFDHVFFVDQQTLIPKEGRYFNDICHLTHEGCERFVDNIVAVILELM